LNDQDFNWELAINTIAYIEDTGKEQVLKARFDIREELLRPSEQDNQ
jgi:hypothetical protein